MKSANAREETPARPRTGEVGRIVLPGRPLVLVAGALVLAATLVLLVFLLLEPAKGLPGGGEQSVPVATGPGSASGTAPSLDSAEESGNVAGQPPALLFEEPVSAKDAQAEAAPAVPEVRGQVTAPPVPVGPESVSAGTRPVGGAASGPTQAPAEPVARPSTAAKGPRLVIVIDDLGDHPLFSRDLLDLPFPVTQSILPNRPHTRSVEAMLASHGVEVLLHQPMQPGSYPRINPGPGVVLIGMAPDQIKAQLAENLAQLPHAVGINNHMGSAFTENAPGMEAVMAVLASRRLFFLDSVTSNKSTGPETAHKAGVPLYRRAVFLDNVRNTATILGQLRAAERLAIRLGRAIAIGHPYGETLQALKIWAKERDPKVSIVTLRGLGPES